MQNMQFSKLSALDIDTANAVPCHAYSSMQTCASCGAGQKPVLKSKQGAFQIINSVEMFKPISKFTKQARGPPLRTAR